MTDDIHNNELEDEEGEEVNLADDLLDEIGVGAEDDVLEGFGILPDAEVTEEDEEDEESDEESLEDDAEDVDYDRFDDIDEI